MQSTLEADHEPHDVNGVAPEVNWLGRHWERLLWSSRMVVLVAVIGSLLLALAAFVIGAADTVSVLSGLFFYLSPVGPSTAGEPIRDNLIADIVKAVDAFLVGAVLLVVGLGLYELFISRIDLAESSEDAARVLSVKTLDDLKERISRLVLLILSVEFFGMALKLNVTTVLDLLLLALAILLIAAAVYLTGKRT
jgi:uncharacterized membrane protein YqhA